MIGRRLGPYEIVARLGAGGMGEVFRARDTRLGREVAIKILPVEYARDRAAVERFLREARMASTLSHPHICTIFDTGEDDGLQYLVMELLDGQPLQELIAASPLAPARAIELGIEIADGLDAAHQHAIVHRDLKPANIFVTARGQAKILDFGVAKAAAGPGETETIAGLTSAGQAIGTVAYMSPEQARGEPVDARSDLFALGLVLYEMLTGQAAFAGPTNAVTFDAILNKQPAPLRTAAKDPPVELERLISRLLAKTPDARPATARVVLHELRELHRTTTAVTGARSGGAAARPQVSVAVLPFANLSPDPENEYLADGLTEELISALGQVNGLRVAGRTSSFAFKGQSPDVSQVAAKLGVTHVLTGGVRRAGQRLRVTVELVNASDGFQIWAERFDRPADDVFALQDEIASGIAEKLKLSLRGDDSEDSRPRRGTGSQEAQDLYLKGRFLLNQRGDGIVRALECFTAATKLDEHFALGYAGMAEASSVLGLYSYAPESSVMPAARAAAERALALDPSLVEPHGPLVLIRYLYEWDWPASAAEFARAMAKNQNAIGPLVYRALELGAAHGRFDEARAMAAKVIKLDPLSPNSYLVAANIHYCASDYAAALGVLAQAAELHPNLWTVLRVQGLCQGMQGQFDLAFASLTRAVELSGGHPWTYLNLAFVSQRRGDAAEVRRWIETGRAHCAGRYVQPSGFGLQHWMLGEKDEAFVWFERSVAERDLLPVLNHFRGADGLYEDPRWQALMRRIGLVPAVGSR